MYITVLGKKDDMKLDSVVLGQFCSLPSFINCLWVDRQFDQSWNEGENMVQLLGSFCLGPFFIKTLRSILQPSVPYANT